MELPDEDVLEIAGVLFEQQFDIGRRGRLRRRTGAERGKAHCHPARIGGIERQRLAVGGDGAGDVALLFERQAAIIGLRQELVLGSVFRETAPIGSGARRAHQVSSTTSASGMFFLHESMQFWALALAV